MLIVLHAMATWWSCQSRNIPIRDVFSSVYSNCGADLEFDLRCFRKSRLKMAIIVHLGSKEAAGLCDRALSTCLGSTAYMPLIAHTTSHEAAVNQTCQ